MKNSGLSFLSNRTVSIRARITTVTLIFVVLVMLLTSLFSYWRINYLIDENISKNLNLIAENQSFQLNNTLLRIEDEVNVTATFLYNQISSPDDLKDDNIRSKTLARTEQFFATSIQNTDQIVANFVYISPDYLDGDVDGYYYQRGSDGVMKNQPIEDYFYNTEQSNSSGWYYVAPTGKEESRWAGPYNDPHQNIFIISYTVPVYIEDVLVCRVGIDMDFDYLMQTVENINTRGGGSAYLTSSDWKIHYRLIEGDNGNYLEALPNANEPTFDVLLSESSDQNLIRFDQDGEDSVMSFVTLRNGMKLVVYESYKNAYKARTDTVLFVSILSSMLGVVFIILSVINSNILSRPIKELTKAAQKIGSGDFDVVIPDCNITEIQILANTLRSSSDQLRKYTKNMENLIYIDDLTHVKNKAAYSMAVENIQHHIDTEPNYCFGVAMFDMNYLKNINDKYGHEAGDTAIKICSNIICKVYEHSPVFRVGGDEFVVILTGHDYENRVELEEKFFDELKINRQSSTHFYEAVSIAYGMAVYDKDMDSNYMHVFSRADFEMYKCKNKDHLEVGTSPR